MTYDPHQPRDGLGRWGAWEDPSVREIPHYNINGLAKESLKGKLSDNEISALQEYSATSSGVNKPLRSNKPIPFLALKNKIDLLDSAISKSSLPRDIEVFRIVRSNFFEKKLLPNIGNEIIDNGFLSTTPSAVAARDLLSTLSEDYRGPYSILKLHIPKNYNAIAMTEHLTENPDDMELLLKRGTRFRLLDQTNIQVLK